MIYLEVRKIYQPGYSGGRGERQKIYLALECELSSVAAILCVIVRPERTPQENLFGGRSGRMAEDQAAGMPPATETNALASGAGGVAGFPAQGIRQRNVRMVRWSWPGNLLS